MTGLSRAGIGILVVAVFGAGIVHAQTAEMSSIGATVTSDPEPDATTLRLIAGRSTVVDIGSPITRVSLTSAEVADAMVTSQNQVLVHGKMPGTISMFVWNRAGALRRYEVAVQRDMTRLTEQMKQLLPNEPIDARSNGRYVVLSGTVSNKAVIDQAVNVAMSFVDKREDVVTVLQVQEVRPSNQVLLRVRFAEVSRSALTEFGTSFFTSPTGIENTLGRVTTQQFSAPGFSELQWTKDSSDFGSPVTSAEGKFTFSDFLNLFLLSERYDLGLMIRALQTRGLFQSLAEPNLVAESGKEASFLAGGEFPIPVAQGSGGNVAISVQFKEFGIRLNFTPTVVGNRIHLKVRPEVSALDFNNAVQLQGFRIPALTTRRTETELELGNGQTFAIAGLMNNQVNSTMQKIPGIGDIPILGQLFRSRAAHKQQTELVVMITPQILPNNAVGVTNQLPRLQEPHLPPMPDNRTFPAPPPAFQSPGPGAGVTPIGPGGAVASGSAASPARPVMSDSERRAEEARVKEEQAQEKKRLQLEAKRQQEEMKRQEAEAKRLEAEEAKRQKAELKRQQEEAKQLQRFIEQQAKLQAEEAKRLAEMEKKQREAAGNTGSR
jgi:pilus assembly protein CpaC